MFPLSKMTKKQKWEVVNTKEKMALEKVLLEQEMNKNRSYSTNKEL